MDWAAEHARARNAPWWKSFTTGKSAAKLGGIPHDTCKSFLSPSVLCPTLTLSDGMTSLSVRQYILGVLKAHGLNEKDVTKFQTGGPDGDLGSSELDGFQIETTADGPDEILLSKDKTVAIIDGSGVLYDPAGLDRSELVRLAKARKPINFFAKEKLGPEGYQILVDQKDIQLPCELGSVRPRTGSH